MGVGWLGMGLVVAWCLIASVTWVHKPAKESEQEINLDDVRGAGL